ncbi:M23 family metallopeptidase [Hazenella coriacea]|uniref:Stage IV sporulation protein FA n=1 Tax=Hazenella coriacea TaxID=1179467 RepID=A0A4R3LBC6_9BACL|nr:M23 family metallopeptidase [Hazenella coriacea]TCS96495.1 stage IV sporulation protein FA [Hazenella coriacea]
MKEEWSQNIKKRREQQVRLIKQGISTPPPPSGPVPFKEEKSFVDQTTSELAPWNQGIKQKSRRERRLVYQFIGAGFLFVLTFLVFQSNSPTMRPVEQFTVQVMTRDFNFSGMSQWYQQIVGTSPSILPAFWSKLEAPKATSISWGTPVNGTIVYPFDNKRKGVVIRSTIQSPVGAAAEGWVIFAGQKEGLGNTVVIQHGNGRETWYGWLQEITVKEKDWVQKEQPIGKVGEKEGQPLVYIALKKDEQFIDPTGVIFFE